MKNLVDQLQEVFSDLQNKDRIEPAVTAIIQAGGVDSSDKYGKNVLFYAIESGNTGLVTKILAAGADPNKKDSSFDSALMFAINSGASSIDNSIIVTLLEYGADVNTLNVNGETPLKLALDLERKSCIKSMLTHGAVIPEGYARFIRNADLLARFGDVKLIRIVLWGELNDLQKYLAANQELSADAINNALDAIHALRTTDNREPVRASAIQKELEAFKDINHPSRVVSIYRSIIERLQQVKNLFEKMFFRTPEVKVVASKTVNTIEQSAKSETINITNPDKVVKKDYLGKKRKYLVRDYDKENTNSENIEILRHRNTTTLKPRE